MATGFPTLDEDTPLTPPPRLGRSKRAGYVTSPAPRAMSSSAAKRRSVLALGSIQHLQHFYAKQKTAEPAASPHPLARPIPALNRPAALQISEEEEEEEGEADSLPPTPLAPDRIELKPYEDVEKEAAPTLEEAWREVDDVCRRWGLVEHVKSSQRAPSMSEKLSQDGPSSHPLSLSRSQSPTPSHEAVTPEQNLVLSLLTATTAAIRLVQRYVLALPPPEDSTLSNGLGALAINESPLTARHHSQLGVSTAARPRSAANALPRSVLAPPSTTATTASDPLTTLRKASLDVLTALREMELRHRTSSKDPPPPESTVSEDGEAVELPLDNFEGHLYREDVTLEDLRGETHVVRDWVEMADRVLTASAAHDARGPKSPTRRTFDDLPEWTNTSRFAAHPLAQSHAILSTFLPPALRPRLASSDDLLESLADGQLLCLAYNAALRASHRPWGFVPPSSIHDLSASGATVGRTFRRFENLRVLAAALKLRYNVSLDGSRERTRSAPPSMLGRGIFDARTVARRDDGWRAQLELLVRSWTEAVVYEAVEGEL